MSDANTNNGNGNSDIKIQQLSQLKDALARLLNEVPLGLDAVPLEGFSATDIDNQVASLQNLLADVGQVFQDLRDARIIDPGSTITALTARQVELAALFAARHGDSSTPLNLTAAEVRAHGDPALALEYIKRIWLDHPSQRHALAKLEYAYNASIPGQPHNLVLVGPSYVGKTDTLLLNEEKYSHADEPYEVMFDPTHGHLRVRRQRFKVVQCPNEGIWWKMIRNLLQSLGDPFWDLIKREALIPRTCEFLDRAGTRILAFDDINNAIQVGEDGSALKSKESIFNLAKALREFAAQLVLQKVNCSIVLSGVPIALTLRESNTQFANRFNDVVWLKPYGWDRKRPEEALLFMSQVQSLLEDVPLAQQTPPTDYDFPLIAKLHWATDGNVGHLVGLVKDAALYALALGHQKLEEDHLAYAFDNRNMSRILPEAARGVLRGNPFRTGEFQYPIESEYAQIRVYADLIR